MKMRYIIILLFFSSINIFSQIAGEKPGDSIKDTLFIFEPSEPLIDYQKLSGSVNSALGLDILITNSGFGAGMFYHRYISKDWLLFGEFFITGARKSDEIEKWNYLEGYWRVLNKINRLYRLPIAFGAQKFLFREKLQNSFRPYISAGIGPAIIFAVPYSENRDPLAEPINFFSALDETDIYVRPNFMFSFGAYITTGNTAMIGVNFKYSYIPFGGYGLESIANNPLEDLGGVILSISIGKFY
jgi:hypothetical protein